MENNKYIGKSYPIHDSLLKVTGTQKYVCDMDMPNMLHAKLLFSKVAHAKIISIDTSKAEKLDGVVKVFTHLNTSKKLFSSYMYFIDQNCPVDERIFTDKVRYVGDRVAGIVAISKEIAEKAVELIDVVYEELPALTNITDAMNSDVMIHEKGNIICENEFNIGNADKIFADSETVFKDSVHMQRVHHAAMENHACIAEYKITGEFTVWAPCQSVFAVRNTIGEFFNMPYSDVRVIKTTMGGSFGGKQQVILELITACLAKGVEGCVKLEYSRTESILSTTTSHSVDYHIESSVSKDGKIEAMKVNSIIDSGAYVTNAIDLGLASGKKSFRVYKIPNLNYKNKSVYTNMPVSGGFRGWGCPQITTAIELHLEEVARKLKFDPVEFRINNVVRPNDIEPLTKITLGNARIKECLEEGAKDFEWNEKYKNNGKDSGRYKKGVGAASAGHVNGYFGKVQDVSSMILKMNEDGSFILNTAVHDQGCGTLVSMKEIVAEVLDVSMDKVKVLEADTERSPYDVGTFSSRVTYVCGRCALNVAEKVKDIILERAAIILNKRKSYMKIENEFVYVEGNKDIKISFRDISRISQVEHEFEIIATETYANTSNPGAYAAHFAEVEVDTYTGMVKVMNYLAVHDVGRAINRGMVEGQIQGAVQMGIGYALTEEIKIDKNGMPKTKNFKDYVVINAPDMPHVRTKILEFGGDDGPFEAKSIGEVAIVPVMAAIANAVNNALGTNITSFPLTPEKIVAEIIKK